MVNIRENVTGGSLLFDFLRRAEGQMVFILRSVASLSYAEVYVLFRFVSHNRAPCGFLKSPSSVGFSYF